MYHVVMWYQFVIFTGWTLSEWSALAGAPQGIPAEHERKPMRLRRPTPDAWFVEEALEDSLAKKTTPYGEGTGEAPVAKHDEEEEISWMQTDISGITDTENGWLSLLQRMAQGLEDMPKGIRGPAAGQLLRWLSHRVTDVERGQFLGHARGRPADVTALLVAMRESEDEACRLLPGTREHEWTNEVWRQLCQFIDCQPGSLEDLGRPLPTSLPVIMLFPKPLPSDTPPEEYSEEDERPASPEPKVKRRMVQVEMSSGSSDNPRTSASIAVPLNSTGRAELSLTMTMVEEEIEVPTPVATATGFSLPPPAPHGLDAWGLSQSEFDNMWQGWRSGTLMLSEITRVHGPTVAQFVLDHWAPLTLEAYVTPPQGEPGNTERAEGVPDTAEETEDAQLIHVGMHYVMLQSVFGATVPTTPPRPPTFFELGRRMVQYMCEAQAEPGLLATVLQMLSWDRNEEGYDIMLEDYLLELGLPIEADAERADEVSPHHRDILVWMEQELWDDYVDVMEAEAGWESDGVMNRRASQTVSEADCRVWREWAAHVTTPGRERSRSRSPRRQGDATSLMENHEGSRPKPKAKQAGRRSSGSASPSARPSDGDRAEARERERSRHDTARRTTETGEDRPVLPRRGAGRCTEEVRRLNPLGRRSHRHLVANDRAMDINDASLWWLRVLGLRSPAETDIGRALSRAGHEDRLSEVRDLPTSDLLVIMVGLLRITAMLRVECCQMLYTHPHLSQEVEVTVDEEEESMWMQVSTRTSTTTHVEQLATTALEDSLELESHWNGSTTDAYNCDLAGRRRVRPAIFDDTEMIRVLSHPPRQRPQRDSNHATAYCPNFRLWLIANQYQGLPISPTASILSMSQHDHEHGPTATTISRFLCNMHARFSCNLHYIFRESRFVSHPALMWTNWWRMRAQEEGREQEEQLQNEQDQELYRAHQAAQYQAWEDWVLLSTPSDRPRRQRVRFTVQHAGGTSAVACELPMARGRPFQVSMVVEEVEDPIQGGADRGRPSGAGSVDTGGKGNPRERTDGTEGRGLKRPAHEVDKDISAAYVDWKQGVISDDQAIQLVGEHCYVAFLAQKAADMEEVETPATRTISRKKGTVHEISDDQGGN
ncbi:pol [Symbiodinium sp. CCMP2592]|nr:pol [Symbiodinium sp. CCMP2592]